ncbi:MAG: DUF2490 domain-containing protein [Raineya sp.]|nr:DUF2490 domain-containing protein [Raineya sp.]MDW8297008.1 DUF2490 domain-containing protein [Raineya sp.]
MLFCLILLTLLTFSASSQNRQEFWSKITISKKINNKWNVGGDIQYRSQENYKLANGKRFENDLLQSIRFTVLHKISKRHQIHLIFSPLVYFRSFELDSNDNIIDQREYRWAVGKMQQHTWNRIVLRARLQYEMRFLRIDSPNSLLQHRVRFQTQATLPIFKWKSGRAVNYIIFDEIFVANQQKQMFLEQNRFYNALQVKLDFLELNVGLQKSGQQVKKEWIKRNQWHVSINVLL